MKDKLFEELKDVEFDLNIAKQIHYEEEIKKLEAKRKRLEKKILELQESESK